MINWRPDPEMWRGRTVAILAGGPSMSQLAADAVRGMTRIAINDSFSLAPDADMLYAADLDWWKVHPEAREFGGMKVCAQRGGGLSGVLRCVPRNAGGGGNSALHAAHIATDAGADRILLLGIDLDDRHLTHWHGQHGGSLRNPTPISFLAARAAWARFSSRSSRPEVINCSTASALECFPKMSLEDALC